MHHHVDHLSEVVLPVGAVDTLRSGLGLSFSRANGLSGCRRRTGWVSCPLVWHLSRQCALWLDPLERMKHTLRQQRESCPAIAHTLDQFELVHMALNYSIVLDQGQSCQRLRPVFPEYPARRIPFHNHKTISSGGLIDTKQSHPCTPATSSPAHLRAVQVPDTTIRM